uniref:Putative secreted protein n=1 Tax=Anopheles marajoara TaxID=58244 RepID=A0A2M4C7V4_9DIPT
MAQHAEGLVVYAVAVSRANAARSEVRYPNLAYVRRAACSLRLRVQHARHPDDAPAEADTLCDHHADATAAFQRQKGLLGERTIEQTDRFLDSRHRMGRDCDYILHLIHHRMFNFRFNSRT